MKNLLITLSTAALVVTPIIALNETVNTSTKQENLQDKIGSFTENLSIINSKIIIQKINHKQLMFVMLVIMVTNIIFFL